MNTVFEFFQRSFRAKILGGLVVMLVLFLGTIGLVMVLNAEQESSSIAINDCGKLRMLSQRIAKTALMLSSNSNSAKSEMGEAISRFDAIMGSLIGGDRVRALGPTHGKIRRELLELEGYWRMFRSMALELQNSRNGSAARQRAIEFIDSQNTVLLAQANVIVGALEARARDRVNRLMLVLYILLVAGCFVFVALVGFIKNAIEPLMELTRVSEQVSHGDYTSKLDIQSKDEFGQLGAAFDRMVQKIGRQMNLMELSVSNLEVAKKQAEADLEEKGEFLALMSHEIRAPLNGIVGMTHFLNLTDLNSDQKKFAESANVSGRALLETLDSLLDFSRIEAGRLDLESVPFDVRDCIRESIDIVSHSAIAKGLELTANCDSDLPSMVFGDPTRLRQVLVNLAGNAVKFTDEGGVEISVKELSDSSGSKLDISVSDTGVGIDQNEADRLFKLYGQANAATVRKFGGTGIGLAVSKRLVEAMGGKIWLESEKGVGTTFRFTVAVGLAAAYHVN